MSEVRLVLRDAQRDLSGTFHGSDADRLVAALTAEPETIEELDQAVRRFARRGCESHFGWFRNGIDDQPYDAGVVIIDLAARLVAYDSTYSHPSKEGCVRYHDGEACTDVGIYYLLSDDWKICSHVEGWQSEADQRRAERAARPPLDARAVLYGRPLLEHIARGCYAAFIESSEVPSDDQAYDLIKQIHAGWLLTPREDLRGQSPREDLRGQSPREVMFAKKRFIEHDLNSRCNQWSHLEECPPIIDRDSSAYRLAGFGTHEMVKYYYLVRELLESCSDAALSRRHQARAQYLGVQDFLVAEMPRLELAREAWLDAPDPECHMRTPRSITENERLRQPEAVFGRDAMADPDCPCCQMMADLPGPTFWHLDGCNMDHEFAFAIFYETREEWEEEQRSWEDFNRKYEARRQEAERLGVQNPGVGISSSDYLWQRSFVANESEVAPLPIRLFVVGTFLSELTVDIQDAGGERSLVDGLSRDYGNLREVLQSDDLSLAEALAEPVLANFVQTLDEVAAAHEELQEKCEDLQLRLRRFLEPPSEAPDNEYWPGDDEIRF